MKKNLDFIAHDFMKLNRTLNTFKCAVQILKKDYGIDNATICSYITENKCEAE